MLSKIGLFPVKEDTCIVKMYEAKNIKEMPAICPMIGKDMYLKNFSKFKKYNFTPLKNILIALITADSFFATVIILLTEYKIF